MTEKVLISALKSQLSKHLRAAEAGQVIDVMDRARVIARLVPVESAISAGLEITPAARPFASVRKLRPRRAAIAVSSLVMLADDRGKR